MRLFNWLRMPVTVDIDLDAMAAAARFSQRVARMRRWGCSWIDAERVAEYLARRDPQGNR